MIEDRSTGSAQAGLARIGHWHVIPDVEAGQFAEGLGRSRLPQARQTTSAL